MSESTNLGAEPFGGGWVGTCARWDGAIAVVTTVAPTQDAAIAAARRWLQRQEPEGPERAYAWLASERFPGRWVVAWSRKLGLEAVPLERC
ncbi:MAG: hypothetical protein ACHREM_03845 [Polyangiales bacterium]